MKTATRQRLLRLLGVLLFCIILWNVDVGRSLAAVLGADPLLVGAALGLLLPLVFLKALRWWFLARLLGIRSLSVRRAYGLYWSGILAGTVTPGRVGEFAKAYSLGRAPRVAPGHALATVLCDRAFDAYLLAVLGTLAIWWYDVTALGDGLLLAVGLALGGLPLVLFQRRLIERLTGGKAGRLGGWLGSGMAATSGSLMDGVLGLLRPRALVAVALTVAAYGVFYLQCYLLARGIRLPLDWWDVILMMSVANLVSLIPISVAGLGTREAALIFFFGRQGLPAESAVAYSLLVLGVFYLGAGGMGLVAWLWRSGDAGREYAGADAERMAE